MGNTTTLHEIRFSLETDIHFRNCFMVMMVTNVVGSVLASSLNVLIILAFVKLPSLRTPSNILILSLAISDFGVGLVVQPTYFAIVFAVWTNDLSLLESSWMLFSKTFPALFTSSLVTVAAITIDRFLALRLHLRYQELVTSKRSFIIVITIWILSLSWGVVPDSLVVDIVDLSLICCMLLLTIVLMVNISRVVHRHSLQLQAQQQPAQPTINMPRYKKSINTMYYIIGAFVVCCCPYLTIITLRRTTGRRGIAMITAQIFTLPLWMANSTLNPVIYFWRIQEMRTTVVQLLRSFRCQSRTTN